MSIPDAPDALAAYMTVTSVASLDWLEPYVASELAGEELVRRYHYGLDLRERGGETIEAAEVVQRRLTAEIAAALRAVDALVWSTMPTPAPLLFGEITPEEMADPLAAPYTDCWTVVANLAGIPALSVPAPVDGLPVGRRRRVRPGATPTCWRSQPPAAPDYFLPDFSPGALVDSAAMNASWGTSTRPTIFIRFLPSFCFSRSLRLRVMSPP